MFKFRRRSLCSSKEIFTPRGTSENSNNVKADDIKPIAGQVDQIQMKKCPPSSLLSTQQDQSSRSRSEEKESKGLLRGSVSEDRRNSSDASSQSNMTKWSFNGEKFKANFKKSFIGQVMCDRKRKERHESASQGQEKKVIRSQSDDEGANDAEKINDFKRTLSHDDFNRKNYEKDFLRTLKGSENATQSSSPANIKGDNMINHIMEKGSEVPRSNIPFFNANYEPELQRQMERSVNYNVSSGSSSLKIKKTHRRRHRSPRPDGSSDRGDEQIDSGSSSLVEVQPQLNAEETGDEIEREDAESPISSTSTSNSDSSVSTTDDSQRSIPLVKINDSTKEKDFELDFNNKPKKSQALSFLESISGPVPPDHVMLSPRSGFLIREAIDLPPSPPMQQIELDPPLSRQSLLGENESTKINSLTRQIASLKRRLKDMEEDYEQVYGYRPSHADKLNNKDMRKCLMQLAKAKKDFKQLKEDPASVQQANLARTVCPVPYPQGSAEYLKSLEETVNEIQGSLDLKRRKTGRPEDPEKMSSTELSEEKNVMQRQLLILEKRHGRPSSKQEKDIVRPLYDRYRAVKKSGFQQFKGISMIKDTSIDLVPIIEHETLELPEVEDGVGSLNSTSVLEIRKKESPTLARKSRLQDIDVNMELDNEYNAGGTGGGSSASMENEGFNEMTLHELEKRQMQAKEEKRRLRNFLRNFESDFQEATGRPPQKEEKYSSVDMETQYQKYKRIRATIRLLDVLITKKKFPHLMVVDINKSED